VATKTPIGSTMAVQFLVVDARAANSVCVACSIIPLSVVAESGHSPAARRRTAHSTLPTTQVVSRRNGLLGRVQVRRQVGATRTNAAHLARLRRYRIVCKLSYGVFLCYFFAVRAGMCPPCLLIQVTKSGSLVVRWISCLGWRNCTLVCMFPNIS